MLSKADRQLKPSTLVISRPHDAGEAGDIGIPVRKGVIKIEDIHGEIGEIVAGKKEGRVLDKEITIFKSVGMAITDVSTATALYEIARKAKMGTALDLV
jgi:ornithine cyclodeaminase/alanine dehydrogenase-like protein (mu-crystallin family)